MARRIHGDQLDLGLQLNIDYAEIQQVKRSHAEFVEATLNILMVSADVQIIRNLQNLTVSFIWQTIKQKYLSLAQLFYVLLYSYGGSAVVI